jgi:hypothetical protein
MLLGSSAITAVLATPAMAVLHFSDSMMCTLINTNVHALQGARPALDSLETNTAVLLCITQPIQ